jgi:hypothetical protein
MRKRADGGGFIVNFCRANHFGGHPHSAAIHGVSEKVIPLNEKTTTTAMASAGLIHQCMVRPRGISAMPCRSHQNGGLLISLGNGNFAKQPLAK